MSVVDDLRKLIQDLVAPDLRAIHAQLEGMDKTIGARFETMDRRLESLESKMDLKFTHMDCRFDQVVDYTKMREQMDEIPKSRQEVAGKTTQQ